MSLFNQLQWQLIENPSQLKQRKEIVKKQKQNTKEQKRMQELKEMKAKLSPDEYKKWYKVKRNKDNKKRRHERYVQDYAKVKAERDAISEEVLSEVEYKYEKEQNIDEYYTEKFREDDTDWEWRYRYSWRASPLAKIKRVWTQRYEKPVRITDANCGFNALIERQLKMQWNVYKLVRAHLDEIEYWTFAMAKEQKVTARPMRGMYGRILELAEESGYPKHQICEIARALKDGTYMAGEVFLWRISWIFGDVIVTSMGHMFRIALENNLKWLTPDTVEEIHQQRLNYKHKEDKCPIRLLYNAYLIKVPACKIIEKDWIKDYWHYSYYVVPMWNKFYQRRE